jgi:hypothetical protein
MGIIIWMIFWWSRLAHEDAGASPGEVAEYELTGAVDCGVGIS